MGRGGKTREKEKFSLHLGKNGHLAKVLPAKVRPSHFCHVNHIFKVPLLSLNMYIVGLFVGSFAINATYIYSHIYEYSII